MDTRFRYAQGVRSFVRQGRDIDDAILKANGIIQKDVSTPFVQKERLSLPDNSSKLDISSIIEAKVSKLVEAKIAELLGT